jgi:hypothetical protein
MAIFVLQQQRWIVVAESGTYSTKPHMCTAWSFIKTFADPTTEQNGNSYHFMIAGKLIEKWQSIALGVVKTGLYQLILIYNPLSFLVFSIIYKGWLLGGLKS